MIDKHTYKTLKDRITDLETKLGTTLYGFPKDASDFDSNILLILKPAAEIPLSKMEYIDEFCEWCLYNNSVMVMFE